MSIFANSTSEAGLSDPILELGGTAGEFQDRKSLRHSERTCNTESRFIPVVVIVEDRADGSLGHDVADRLHVCHLERAKKRSTFPGSRYRKPNPSRGRVGL